MFKKWTKHNSIEIRSIVGIFLFLYYSVPSAAPHLEIIFPSYPEPPWHIFDIESMSVHQICSNLVCNTFFDPTSMPAKFGLDRIKNKKSFPATYVSQLEQAACPGKGPPAHG